MLEKVLIADGLEAKTFVAMRYWHPYSAGAARAQVKAFDPDKIVLLPLYPQYFDHHNAVIPEGLGRRAAKKAGLAEPADAWICCYPWTSRALSLP